MNAGWPPPHVDELVRLHSDGRSFAQIALSLNRQFGASYTRASISGKLHRKGIATRPAANCPQRPDVDWDTSKDAALRSGAMAGKTLSQVAAGLGVATGSVAYRAVKLGVSFRRGRRAAPKVPGASAVRFGPNPNVQHQATTYIERDEPAGAIRPTELEPHHCRWPIGDPQAEAFRHCGRAKQHGSPYCAGHHRRAYKPNAKPAP